MGVGWERGGIILEIHNHSGEHMATSPLHIQLPVHKATLFGKNWKHAKGVAIRHWRRCEHTVEYYMAIKKNESVRSTVHQPEISEPRSRNIYETWWILFTTVNSMYIYFLIAVWQSFILLCSFGWINGDIRVHTLRLPLFRVHTLCLPLFQPQKCRTDCFLSPQYPKEKVALFFFFFTLDLNPFKSWN